MALKYVGVNLSGLEFGSGIGTQGSTYVLPGQENYSYWQSEGSNIIRLPFTWERLQPTAGGALDQTYLNYLKSSVAWAQAHGETIILDMHNYGLYNGAPATAAQMSDVWTKLGAQFNGNSSVMFDLMNEPNGISAQQWESNTQQVVNNMRAAGITNELLLEGTQWSGAYSWITSGNAAAYNNFSDPLNKYMFDVHQYLDSDSSGTSATAVPGSGSTRLVDITNWAASTGHKLFLGETGLANNAGSENEMKAMINYMNAHTDVWQGMTLWGAGPWWGSNYIYNVNPTGLGTSNVTNASDINDLLSYLTPDSTGGTGGTPPVAQLDNFSGQENAAISGNVLADNGHGADTDPNGQALSVTAGTVATAHGGTATLNADGSFTYHPASNFTGTDSFTYTLKDTGGLSSTGTVTLAVNAPTGQSAPVAQADNITAQQYHAVNGNVLSNNGNGADTDPNGLALSVTAANLTTAHGGTVVLNADGTFTYNPAASFYGADSFTYTLKDSAGLSTTGTVNVNVNAAPVAHPDDISGQSNAAISGNVLANNGHGADSDPVSATLGVAAAALTTAHGGHVSLQADGSFTYTSASGYSGTDSFNYVLLDGRGGQADGTATVTVSPSTTPVYTPPIAQADNFSGQENAAVSGNVLANNGHGADTDPNGLALSVTAGTVTTAHGGTAALNADGSFTYHPASNFYGADSFTYALHDTAGLSATGMVSIAVSQTVTTGSVIYGTAGNDTLNAASTGGTVYGLGGNDVIHGNNGNDTLYGGDGNDKLYGSGGNDILYGGAGADTMTGGSGNDVFKYNNVSEGGDIITDFHHLTGDTDTLDLTALFVANGLGSIGTSAAIQQHYLVLSQHADGLHVDFDKDGLGGAAAVHLVTLSGTTQQHLDVFHQILTASS